MISPSCFKFVFLKWIFKFSNLIFQPQLSQAILESLENIDPNDPWVVDENGKHTNVAAVCDWPDYDSEDDESSNPFLSSVLGMYMDNHH